MKNFTKKTNFGFTLVETLVALFVFTLPIMAVMSALSGGISGASFTRDKMIATHLAQEGIEYLRNMRDTQMIYTTDKKEAWAQFVILLKDPGCEGSNPGCYFVDVIENFGYPYCETNCEEITLPEMPILNIQIETCVVENKCPSFLYGSQGYKYNAGNGTDFQRAIWFETISENEIKVYSKVRWDHRGVKNSVLFSEYLSAWIE